MKKLIICLTLLMSLSFPCFAEEALDPCNKLVTELAKRYMAEDLGADKAALFTHSTAKYHSNTENWIVLFFAPNDGSAPAEFRVMSSISYIVDESGHVEFGEIMFSAPMKE